VEDLRRDCVEEEQQDWPEFELDPCAGGRQDQIAVARSKSAARLRVLIANGQIEDYSRYPLQAGLIE